MKHFGEKPFSCSLCDQAFYRNDYLQNHFKTHFHDDTLLIKPLKSGKRNSKLEHDSPANLCTQYDNLVCCLCQREFVNKQGLEVHFRNHFGKKPYMCPFCPMAFSGIDNLQPHIRTHIQENPTLSTENSQEKDSFKI